MRLVVLCLLTLMLFSCVADEEVEKKVKHNGVIITGWNKVKTPTLKNPQVYGSYSAGCFDGAEALPSSGYGYQLVRKGRNRFYAHESMINYLEKFAKKVKDDNNATLLISDLSQARGGPPDINKSKHLSHQTGLDVDIWFRFLEDDEKLEKSEGSPSVVNWNKTKIDPVWWKKEHRDILKYAASFPEVERIFVNAAIKKRLCKYHANEEWMAKIRPWWGHSSHFHVRIACPDDSSHCKDQAPVPKGDGCDESLDWWFSQEAKNKLKESATKKPRYPVLPYQCRNVYDWESESLAKK
ncbi:penicillin-insensitive murein endopeptidase [Rickettsiales bacterium]|nr:penicillin-insensitive murein endopeptidase [Rickettsiales bacterium]